MATGIIGRKLGMTRVFTEDGTAVPVTVIEAGPCHVLQVSASQAQLVGQFGQPRLDVWEGDARKLQFSGTACILDLYLYPTTRSRDPLASYAEARRSDGRDVDKAACVTALRGSGTR